jgi:hypothetical protein
MMEGSGFVVVTNGSGCGSGRPKNIRILRIQMRSQIPNTGEYCTYIIVQIAKTGYTKITKFAYRQHSPIFSLSVLGSGPDLHSIWFVQANTSESRKVTMTSNKIKNEDNSGFLF